MKHGKFEAKRAVGASQPVEQRMIERAAPQSTEQPKARGPAFLATEQPKAKGPAFLVAEQPKTKRPAFLAAEQPKAKRRGLPRWLRITIPLLVLAALAACQLYCYFGPLPEGQTPKGMTKEETLAFYRGLAQELEQREMNLTLFPSDSASHDMPILLTISPSRSRVRVDLTGLEQDLKNGVGKVQWGRYQVDPAKYISLDRAALRELAEQTEQEWEQPYLPSFAGVSTTREGQREIRLLTVNIGIPGRVISADEIYEALINAYYTGNMAPRLTYETFIPQPLNVEEICARFRTAPVDAKLNETTFEITPDVPGLGVIPEELQQVLTRAHAGIGYTVPLRTLQPDVTVADIEAVLYANILGEAHTPHIWDDDRTTNLILACAEINGTVVMPGQIFSFNDTVGERTREKGYREATAYIAGASVPEIGGGVCQVASSIYYATLQADLPAVERHAHTYLVTYVPEGMDAAIYWGRLDFQFENISPYPIKIEATVADGDVHILLRGKEWKDYTVKLSYEILEEIPWEVQERAVYDNSYAPGETIVSPYTGYLIATYKTLYDPDGTQLDTERIEYSRYAKRDKVIAVRIWNTEPSDSDDDDD